MRSPEEARLLDPYGEAFEAESDHDEDAGLMHRKSPSSPSSTEMGRVADDGGREAGDRGKEEQGPKISVLGRELQGPVWVQFSVCVGGVFFFSILYEYLQERIFRHEGYHHGAFMTLGGMLAMTVAPAIALTVQGRREEIRQTKWASYVPLTVVLALQQACGTGSLSYINFPVKVVIKSAKLIPTMALGLIVLRRSYSFAEYSAAVMLWLGVAGFTLVDSAVSPKFSTFGVSLLVVAVLGDSVGTNLQERLLQQLHCSKEQMMFSSNLMGAAWVALVIGITGELRSALQLIWGAPHIGGLIVVMSFCQYMSVSFYLALVQRFGGVVAVIVTSCRKIFTLMLSFAVFPKPMSWGYVPTGLLALVGIFLSAIARQKDANPVHIRALEGSGAILIIIFATLWFKV